MCEACVETEKRSSQRDKIWKLDKVWHCMIVGTCLSMADLKRLGRRLNLRIDNHTDYAIHGHFVREAASQERTGKLLNKALDRKFATAVRRFSQAKTAEEIETLWDAAFAAGDIPGPLWAAATHPALTTKLATRIHGEVHMLSHLVGASNRADIRALNRLEAEKAELQDRLERQAERSAARAKRWEQEVADLRAELERTRNAHARAKRLEAELEDAKREIEALRSTRCPERSERNDPAQLLRIVNDQREELQDLRRAKRASAAREAALHAECAALEMTLEARLSSDGATAAGNGDDADDRFDLAGRCILYVGGRTSVVCHLRALVERWNGKLIHHDGGLEKSLGELASAVTRADAVLFPADCVSHGAVNRVKQLCRQTMKPFVPLRSGGLSSSVAGLQDGLQQLQRLQLAG